MALATWPAGIPSVPQRDSFKRANARPLQSTEVEDGPPIKRLTMQTRILRMSYVLRLTQAQKALFDTFYETTISRGADHFVMSVPLVNGGAFVDRRCYIDDTPEDAETGGDFVVTSFTLCVFTVPLT